MCLFLFFFFHDTATTEIYTLSLHDALPISGPGFCVLACLASEDRRAGTETTVEVDHAEAADEAEFRMINFRSEEHTSELQSPVHLVCRLLLEKKKKKQLITNHSHIIVILIK